MINLKREGVLFFPLFSLPLIFLYLMINKKKRKVIIKFYFTNFIKSLKNGQVLFL